MGKHSIVEAKTRLSELINRALRGESVVITCRGRPVVEFKPISAPTNTMCAPAKPITDEALDWLVERRAGRRMQRQDAVTLVRKMRDEWP
jgi:antitoxin (DNA-binding transcriptional repressor) of toxin-antitoxin stability system